MNSKQYTTHSDVTATPSQSPRPTARQLQMHFAQAQARDARYAEMVTKTEAAFPGSDGEVLFA